MNDTLNDILESAQKMKSDMEGGMEAIIAKSKTKLIHLVTLTFLNPDDISYVELVGIKETVPYSMVFKSGNSVGLTLADYQMLVEKMRVS